MTFYVELRSYYEIPFGRMSILSPSHLSSSRAANFPSELGLCYLTYSRWLHWPLRLTVSESTNTQTVEKEMCPFLHYFIYTNYKYCEDRISRMKWSIIYLFFLLCQSKEKHDSLYSAVKTTEKNKTIESFPFILH